MIYFENIQEPQRIFLPNNGNYDGDETLVEFWLRNTIERRELRTDTGDNFVNGADGYLIEADGGIVLTAQGQRVRVLGGNASHYYSAEIALPAGLPNGEYEYCLRLSGSYALSKGLAVIGKIERVAEQATTSGFELKQAK